MNFNIAKSIYVVNLTANTAVQQFETDKSAVNWIDSQPIPQVLGTYSRYALSKHGLYPKTKEGDQKLINDLRQARANRG